MWSMHDSCLVTINVLQHLLVEAFDVFSICQFNSNIFIFIKTRCVRIHIILFVNNKTQNYFFSPQEFEFHNRNSSQIPLKTCPKINKSPSKRTAFCLDSMPKKSQNEVTSAFQDAKNNEQNAEMGDVGNRSANEPIADGEGDGARCDSKQRRKEKRLAKKRRDRSLMMRLLTLRSILREKWGVLSAVLMVVQKSMMIGIGL